MKTLFKVSIFLGISLFLVACGQLITRTTSPTATITATIIPSFTTTIEPTVTKAYATPTRPTSIPTIDPTHIPEILSKAFSIKALEGVNGHTMQQVTGWKNGLGGGFLYTSCTGYIWLDTEHLLLYPATGQVDLPEGWSPAKINVVRQPVVINLKNGLAWLPPVKAPASPETCDTIEWSSKLGILILPEDSDSVSTVSTYTYDGFKLASYPGRLLDVSPSGTKVLLEDNTVIDLQTNKKTTLTWELDINQEPFHYDSYWTADETRIFRCCYYYADLSAGISYHSERSDFQNTNDSQRESWGLLEMGGWIQNDTYFLPQWNWLDYGDISHLPMIDPARRVVIDAREKAGIPEDWSCTAMYTSPDGKYVWLTGFGDSYLIDLINFKAQYYPRETYSSVYWSPDSKFALLENYDSSNINHQYFNLLSLSNNKIQSLDIKDLSAFWYGWWHPTDHVFAYISEDSQKLVLFNIETMSTQELTSPVTFQSYTWSPKGDRIALVAEDGSVWQIDYPALENFEQLTPSISGVRGAEWSPDGKFISFVGISDIYIVETNK